MTTTAPNKVVLTCNITGKTVTWTNKKIIQAKIDQHGSLEAFMSQYKSKGAKKEASTAKPIKLLKPILEEGVAMGKLSPEEYHSKYIQKVYTYSEGPTCTVVTPV